MTVTADPLKLELAGTVTRAGPSYSSPSQRLTGLTGILMCRRHGPGPWAPRTVTEQSSR